MSRAQCERSFESIESELWKYRLFQINTCLLLRFISYYAFKELTTAFSLNFTPCQHRCLLLFHTHAQGAVNL